MKANGNKYQSARQNIFQNKWVENTHNKGRPPAPPHIKEFNFETIRDLFFFPRGMYVNTKYIYSMYITNNNHFKKYLNGNFCFEYLIDKADNFLVLDVSKDNKQLTTYFLY